MDRDLLLSYLTPTPLADRPRDAAHLADADTRTVTVHGNPVRVSLRGAGERRVLLAHGWAGLAQQMGPLASVLVECGFAVVVPHLPGHGDTPSWHPDGTANVGEFAEAITAVAGDVGGVHAIIGHSGGSLAGLIALGRGLEIERFVGIASLGRLRDSVDRHLARMGASEDERHVFEAGMTARFGDEVWDRTDGPAMAAHLGHVPGLLIHDRDDAHVPLPEAAAVADAWPGADLLTTTRYGHHLILRRADVAADILDFLEV